jgi:hypothetical protein
MLKLRNAAIAGFAGALAIGAAFTLPLDQVQAQSQRAAAPITKGQKIVMATHSFNVFISSDPFAPRRARGAAPDPNAPKPIPLLTRLANDRGIRGQEFLAVQMIGGSTPMQHWNQGNGDDSKNIAKVALNKGGVDVFTMSPNAKMPEEGIDHFGDLVIRTNPNARILVQNSWSAYDGNGSTPSVGGTGGGSFHNDQRDSLKIETVRQWIAAIDDPNGYTARLRTQLQGIDRRAGKRMTYVVPVADAVYHLREQVILGKVPGLTRQSAMHLDPIGHATGPVQNLAAYTWFAVMYRQSPVGLTALVNKADTTSAPRERMLQQIAWNAVLDEPMSGVAGRKIPVGEGVRVAAN